MSKMSSNPFTDEEVEYMLDILKTKPQYHTASEKEKFLVYVEIARKLSAPPSNMRRSPLQVRYKIVTLQKGYKKLKAKPTHLSSVHQHTVRYYELLDEIFGTRSQNKRKPKKKEIGNKTNDEILKQAPKDPLLIYNSFIIKEELATDETDKCDKQMSTEENDTKEIKDYSFKVPQEMGTIKNSNVNEHEAEGLNDEDESPGFEIMKKCFNNELMESQKELVNAIQEQDKTFVLSYKNHCKYHEVILRRDRQKIDKMLSKDRKEMLTIFKSVLNAMGKTLSYEINDKNDELITSSEEVENITEGENG